MCSTLKGAKTPSSATIVLMVPSGPLYLWITPGPAMFCNWSRTWTRNTVCTSPTCIKSCSCTSVSSQLALAVSNGSVACMQQYVS